MAEKATRLAFSGSEVPRGSCRSCVEDVVKRKGEKTLFAPTGVRSKHTGVCLFLCLSRLWYSVLLTVDAYRHHDLQQGTKSLVYDLANLGFCWDVLVSFHFVIASSKTWVGSAFQDTVLSDPSYPTYLKDSDRVGPILVEEPYIQCMATIVRSTTGSYR